ncbi:g839 [Coccomyxa elongata]
MGVRKIEALYMLRAILARIRAPNMDEDEVDFVALLESLPDDLGEPSTREQIDEMMSSNWMSDSTGLLGSSDDACAAPSTVHAPSSGAHQVVQAPNPGAHQIVQAPSSGAHQIVQAPNPGAHQIVQAPDLGAHQTRLSHTKISFLRTIYELSKMDPVRNPQGIVSLDEIRNARSELALKNKTGKQGALHALVREHGLVVYMKDIDPALKGKYRLTPDGLSLCKREFD